MRLLIVDHDDSFTFNLVDAFRVLGCEVDVVNSCHCELRCAIQRKITGLPRRPDGLLAMTRLYDALVLSPGPGRPSDYPKTRALLDLWPANRPLLGVCLGMQILNEWSGGETVHAPHVVHGKVSPIFHDGRGVFSGITSPCTVMRYHSLVCKITSPDWEICARTIEYNQPHSGVEGEAPPALPVEGALPAPIITDVPMAMRHRNRPWWGMQFHPESFLTPDGPLVLNKFISQHNQHVSLVPGVKSNI